MKKTITLDATPFMYSHGGVGRTTLTLFEYMQTQNPELQLQLYARRFKGGTLDTPVKCNRITRLRLPKKAEPIMAKIGLIEAMCRADLYHATDHYMPLKHPEKAVVTLHDLLFMVRPEAWKSTNISSNMCRTSPANAAGSSPARNTRARTSLNNSRLTRTGLT